MFVRIQYVVVESFTVYYNFRSPTPRHMKDVVTITKKVLAMAGKDTKCLCKIPKSV
jgi:hypothetical protein